VCAVGAALQQQERPGAVNCQLSGCLRAWTEGCQRLLLKIECLSWSELDRSDPLSARNVPSAVPEDLQWPFTVHGRGAPRYGAVTGSAGGVGSLGRLMSGCMGLQAPWLPMHLQSCLMPWLAACSLGGGSRGREVMVGRWVLGQRPARPVSMPRMFVNCGSIWHGYVCADAVWLAAVT